MNSYECIRIHSYELSNYTYVNANVMMVKDVLFMIFSIRTTVRKHIAFLLLWVLMNVSEFTHRNLFILVCTHPNSLPLHRGIWSDTHQTVHGKMSGSRLEIGFCGKFFSR